MSAARDRRTATSPEDSVSEALVRLLGPMIRREMVDALAEVEAARQPRPELVTVEQVCTVLQISRATLHRLRLEGLPTVLVLDSPRFRVATCIAWLEQRTRERHDVLPVPGEPAQQQAAVCSTCGASVTDADSVELADGGVAHRRCALRIARGGR